MKEEIDVFSAVLHSVEKIQNEFKKLNHTLDYIGLSNKSIKNLRNNGIIDVPESLHPNKLVGIDWKEAYISDTDIEYSSKDGYSIIIHMNNYLSN
jgi:hypothetical protein